MPLHGVAQLFTNRAPGPRPTFKTFKPRQLVFRQRVAGAPPYDRTANARANCLQSFLPRGNRVRSHAPHRALFGRAHNLQALEPRMIDWQARAPEHATALEGQLKDIGPPAATDA